MMWFKRCVDCEWIITVKLLNITTPQIVTLSPQSLFLKSRTTCSLNLLLVPPCSPLPHPTFVQAVSSAGRYRFCISANFYKSLNTQLGYHLFQEVFPDPIVFLSGSYQSMDHTLACFPIYLSSFSASLHASAGQALALLLRPPLHVVPYQLAPGT